jgi:DNA-binding NarL/FixJ family response regulator
MSEPIRIVLVDDHPVVRSGIRTLLEKVEGFEIVGEASEGAGVQALVAETHPDVLLLDMELPDVDGTQVAKQVQQSDPLVKVLALSAHDDPVYIRGLLESGAAGYLMKEEAPDTIIEAVRGVAHGDKGWVSRRVAARVASWMEVPDKGRLSTREQEVLRLMVKGKTNQAIAMDLNISEKTVEKHMGEIFVKLGVTSRVEAAVYAVRAGLVE